MCLITSTKLCNFYSNFGRNEGNKRHFYREKKIVTLRVISNFINGTQLYIYFHISFFFLIKSRNMHYMNIIVSL